MEYLRPASWADALAAKAEHPDAVPVAGGTDVMVELNFDRRRPPALLDLTRIDELAEWGTADGQLRIGATVTYAQVIEHLGWAVPGLSMAARTVGSPQIRNRGTVAGNLGAASPAGDAHPPLLASDAVVEVESVRGSRRIPAREFFVGVKRSALAPDELIRAVLIRPARGPQQFAKIGTRNAMVIAVCSFAIALDREARTAGTGIGSAAPTPVRSPAAEQLLADELPWSTGRPLAEALTKDFGELVAASASPIDDVRGSAAYRRHALSVLARRTLTWAWAQYPGE
jgi:CO/xanthine dehydrogenase FAD-binding subunit